MSLNTQPRPKRKSNWKPPCPILKLRDRNRMTLGAVSCLPNLEASLLGPAGGHLRAVLKLSCIRLPRRASSAGLLVPHTDSGGLHWGLGKYVSNRFLGAADAVVQGPQFEKYWLRAQEQLPWAAYLGWGPASEVGSLKGSSNPRSKKKILGGWFPGWD